MRLLSYNIHKGVGGRDRLYRFERIIEVIESENPDLICLQEVDHNCKRSRYDDQPILLAQAFRFPGSLYQANVYLRGNAGGYGNLILSRWPFQKTHQVSIRLKNRKPRGAQISVVETPEGLLHLVNSHLGLAERERHWSRVSFSLTCNVHLPKTFPFGLNLDFSTQKTTKPRNPCRPF